MNNLTLLEREGGHLVILLIILLIALALHYATPGDEVFIRITSGAFGALLYAMKGNGNVKPTISPDVPQEKNNKAP
jgi:hypothetical protein